MKIPGGVICLISALVYHGLTDQVPHAVYCALERGASRPRLARPPIMVYWFVRGVHSQGIETHRVDGVPVRVYSAEKTLADCFKYRHRLGLDVALEALRRYRERGRTRINELLRYARLCRVEKVMKPYLEAIL